MKEDDDREVRGPSLSVRLTCLLFGGGIGAIIALLLAPKSGQELRFDIADATRRAVDRSREATQALADRAGEYYDTDYPELYPREIEEVGALAGDEDFMEPDPPSLAGNEDFPEIPSE